MKRALILVIALTLSLVIAAYTQATTLGFSPNHTSAVIGNTYDVELTISGLGNYAPPSLSVFDLDVLYDPAILLPSTVVFGDPVLGDQLDIFGFGSIQSVIGGGGSGFLNLFELSLDLSSDLWDFQAGSFTLATVSFDAIGVGTSSLGLSVNSLGDVFGNPLDFQVIEGSVTATPEPATMFLLGTGLVGVAGAARRRKKKQF